MSETFWIVSMICVTMTAIVLALRGSLKQLIFKANKEGINAAIDADTSPKVRITGVVQTKQSKMQVEHDDVEITGIALHDSTMNVKSKSPQPKKSKK
jgi:cytochrome oxidase assembly protein ShyY1